MASDNAASSTPLKPGPAPVPPAEDPTTKRDLYPLLTIVAGAVGVALAVIVGFCAAR